MKSFFNSFYTSIRSPRTSSKPPPMLLVWRWICYHPWQKTQMRRNTDGQKPKMRGQKTKMRISLSPIWNHEPSPTPQSPVEKLKYSPEDCFSAQIIWCKRNDLTTDKLSISLSAEDFANYAKFVFSWPAGVIYGFAVATKGSKSHSHQSLLPDA